MKKSLLISMALATVLATGVYAKGNMNSSGCDYQKSQKMMKKSHHRGFMSFVYNLDLDDKQKQEIQTIRKQMMEKRFSKNESAFTSTDFDKEKYIQIMKQKRQNMIESKAEMIDKVYKVLNKDQKQQLKQMMDKRKERFSSMMKKRMNFDKNCNGRG
ncbi:hypothetical protein CRV01_03570 [Arcobacter sp. CECT 8983]|uniref:Spy/CpxP family protein refolding chaperone n=1 Tax=Arcobacter sp. CECT 8983 TaxID=2044508 RepID=UPI00100ABD58|nr:Spy/CpxP family protein refolding chaperone [Arcobacter sp. CECT 8983]RXJ90249.1 hypothetical protein CRV01_03570 [Arcobacter sp. CECT 8983]